MEPKFKQPAQAALKQQVITTSRIILYKNSDCVIPPESITSIEEVFAEIYRFNKDCHSRDIDAAIIVQQHQVGEIKEAPIVVRDLDLSPNAELSIQQIQLVLENS